MNMYTSGSIGDMNWFKRTECDELRIVRKDCFFFAFLKVQISIT